MQSSLDHIQVNVRQENLAFYDEFMRFLGWKPILELEGYRGFGGSSGGSLWFLAQVEDVDNHYDGPGVNHIGISMESVADVESAIKYIEDKGIAPLFETPRHRDIPNKPGETYFQVMFESPDKVLFEVLYTGPK